VTDTAKAAVFDGIRDAILSGDYGPAGRLIEGDLCERFSASRFEVRTALQDLAAHGLVEFQRNRGARVREISLDETIEITEVRKALEGLVAGRAAERIARGQMPALRQLIKDMRSAVKHSELLRYSELNVELHTMIRDIGGHETTSRLLRQLRDQTARQQVTLSLIPGRPAVSLPQHEAIVEAITAKDAAAAQAAMQEHLQSVVDAYKVLATVAGHR